MVRLVVGLSTLLWFHALPAVFKEVIESKREEITCLITTALACGRGEVSATVNDAMVQQRVCASNHPLGVALRSL